METLPNEIIDLIIQKVPPAYRNELKLINKRFYWLAKRYENINSLKKIQRWWRRYKPLFKFRKNLPSAIRDKCKFEMNVSHELYDNNKYRIKHHGDLIRYFYIPPFENQELCVIKLYANGTFIESFPFTNYFEPFQKNLFHIRALVFCSMNIEIICDSSIKLPLSISP